MMLNQDPLYTLTVELWEIYKEYTHLKISAKIKTDQQVEIRDSSTKKLEKIL